VNDFDEALLGPVLWDLTQGLASIHTAFYSLQIPRSKRRGPQIILKRYSAVLAEGSKVCGCPYGTGVWIFLRKYAQTETGRLLEEMTL